MNNAVWSLSANSTRHTGRSNVRVSKVLSVIDVTDRTGCDPL